MLFGFFNMVQVTNLKDANDCVRVSLLAYPHQPIHLIQKPIFPNCIFCQTYSMPFTNTSHHKDILDFLDYKIENLAKKVYIIKILKKLKLILMKLVTEVDIDVCRSPFVQW